MEMKKQIYVIIVFFVLILVTLVSVFVGKTQAEQLKYYETIVYKQCDLINTYRDWVIELEPRVENSIHPALDCNEFILKPGRIKS